jgi:hypothetical protein
MREWSVGLSLLCAAACTSSGYVPDSDASVFDAAMSGNAGSLSSPNDDRDHDGVCNGTEANLMSDPDRVDTDRDGLPDFTEIAANFIPTDPNVPGPDQVVYMAGSSESTLEFEVRMTVVGTGLGYTGDFLPGEAFDPHGVTARDFYLGGMAVGGQPTDNVRGVEAGSERFESVLGKTRVAFQLRFAVGSTKLANCTIGYPFQYRLKDDNGRFSTARQYLLVVTSDLNANGEHTFCVPASCI